MQTKENQKESKINYEKPVLMEFNYAPRRAAGYCLSGSSASMTCNIGNVATGSCSTGNAPV